MDRTELRVRNHTDLTETLAKFDTFRIGEKLYSAELLIPQLVIRGTDLLEEAATVAAQVLYWGQEAARARRTIARTEAAYRSWRDQAWIDAKTRKHPDTDKYPSDALAEKMYRTRPEYGEWQERQQEASFSAECAEAVYEAFKVKQAMIKAMEAVMRDEAGGAYYTVEEPQSFASRQPATGN